MSKRRYVFIGKTFKTVYRFGYGHYYHKPPSMHKETEYVDHCFKFHEEITEHEYRANEFIQFGDKSTYIERIARCIDTDIETYYVYTTYTVDLGTDESTKPAAELEQLKYQKQHDEMERVMMTASPERKWYQFWK